MSEVLKALDMALHQIEKQFGKGFIMRPGEANITDIRYFHRLLALILPLEGGV